MRVLSNAVATGPERLVAGRHQRGHAGQLALRQHEARREVARGALDLVVEAEEHILAEEERPALGERAAHLSAEEDARRLVAVREVEHGDVLVAPRDERVAAEHRGHAERFVRLDLARDAAVALDGEDHAAGPAGLGRARRP